MCLVAFNRFFGDSLISDLIVEDLDDYVEKRKADGLKDSSIDLELTIAKQMIRKAFYSDKISGYALKVFTRGSNARTRTISIPEYLILLDTAEDYLRPMLITAMYKGMRVESELLRLKWSQVDRKAGFIRFSDKDTKERKAKIIPINNDVAQALDNIVPHVNHPYVFTCRHRPMRKFTHFRKCCIKAGLPYGYKTDGGIVARDIRRTVKTNMVEAGVPEIYRDILLGHSKKGMDHHYIQPKPKILKEAMQKYTTWLDNEIAKCKLQKSDQSSDHRKQF